MAVSFLGIMPVSAATTTQTFDITIKGIQNNKKAFDCLELMNAERTSQNIPAITMDKKLVSVAVQRAAEIAYSWDIGHSRPDGRSCFEGFDNYGYGSGYGACGEILAWGQDTGADVYNAWKNSPHHHEIYLSNYSKVGLCCFEFEGEQYWVGVFQKGDNITEYTQRSSVTVEKTVKIPATAENKAKYTPGSTPQITSLTVNPDASVTIKWDPSENATGYRVFRYDRLVKGYRIVEEINDGSVSQYIDKTVTPGDTAKYKLKAYRISGSTTSWTAYSSCRAELVKPAVPNIISAESTMDSITLNWDKANCAGYKIYRRDGSKHIVVAEIKDPNTTSYTITGLQPNTEYKLEMRAYYLLGSTYVHSNYTQIHTVSTKSQNADNDSSANDEIEEPLEDMAS